MPDEAEQSQLDRIEALCVDTRNVVKRVSVQMFGNSHPERGHVVRIDRLEVSGARTDRWQGVILTALAALVLLIIGAILTGIVRWLV